MPSASDFATPSNDPRAWTAESVGDSSAWTQELSPRFIAALTLIDKSRGQRSGPITVPRFRAEEKELFGGQLGAAKRELEYGRGFVILDRLPIGRISDRKATGIFWLIGQLLGEPVEQNVQGTQLYDVRDSGKYVAQGARFSVTNYESSFHTDNSFGDTVVDYVGLLCLKTARSGGISQLVSGLTALEALRREYPTRSKRSAGHSTLTAVVEFERAKPRPCSDRRSRYKAVGKSRFSVTCVTGSKPATRRPASH
jgi:hypothetical protein